MDLQKVAEEQQVKLEKKREERREQIKAAPPPEPPPAPAPAPKPEPKAPKDPKPSKSADHKVYETLCGIHKQGDHSGIS